MPYLIAAAIGCLSVTAVLLIRTRLVIVTVHGPSMEPALADGDRLLVRRAGLDRVRGGDIVVLASPQRGSTWFVKRAVAVPGDPVPEALREIAGGETVPPGRFLILGDNPAVSADSRRFGYQRADGLLGVMVRRM
ncbi:S26 family signal peptidase [Actinorhabdospora filicis]|uniref:Signal peptidase I n=1 Tax=Actinorhabdospora filicis TaxID=1785913 RepID=A0A9W6ST18_9ACTN|nr:signal peptidase I [Actinorhabdospora filicis]GLZ81976.1 S26 family signal peptidase [Actinorhabdospora filicis]